MNRIDKLFQQGKKNLLSVYFTAGFPEINDSLPIIKALDKFGADMIEIGMPFSDPIADGPVIQDSSSKAIKNGMNLKLLFEQLKDMRKETDLSMLLMGYINPILNMGMDSFIENCSICGIDGCILPDLPPSEYLEKYKAKFEQAGLKNVLLITPQTSEERIRKIDKISEGFIYVVSSYSTTGSGKGFRKEQISYFDRIAKMNLETPLMTGFGISNKEDLELTGKYTSGGIVGSSFIRSLDGSGTIDEKVKRFTEVFRDGEEG